MKDSTPCSSTNYIHEEDPSTTYCIEVFTQLAGVNTQTVIHYQKLGILPDSSDDEPFDSENLRHLARLEQLREIHELSDSALLLVSNLIMEVEHLRQRQRQNRRRLF